MRVAGCLLYGPRQKTDNALIIQESANESMADEILSIWSIRDSEPDAVGVGAVEWNGCSSIHDKVRCQLPWDVYTPVTIPCSGVKVKRA